MTNSGDDASRPGGTARVRQGRRSLGRRVLVAVLAASGAIVVVATAFELSIAYRQDVEGVEAALDGIGESRLESLAEGVWVADDEQIDAQLRGILAIRDIEAVTLERPDEATVTLGARTSHRTIGRVYSLSRRYRGRQFALGTLRVTAGLDAAVHRVRTRLGLIVSTQGVGVLLAAALILLLVQLMVIRPLHLLADQARRQADGNLGQPFTLERSRATPGDELDDLARSLESLRSELAARIEQLGERGDELARDLARRTAERDEALLQRRLQETQKLESLGLLAGGVAHDFNNLLVGILGNASMVLDDLADRPELQARIAQLVSAARRAADLTHQLLAYSGKARFVTSTFDVSALVRELAGLLRTSLSEHASLQLELGDGGPFVEGDATQIRQVVLNLITNASDALGADGGAIRVSIRVIEHDAESLRRAFGESDLDARRYVRIEVADTGEGMDASTRDRMFDPFFSTKETGHGLGLAATLGIVRAHRGAVKVHSEPGEGTTVQVLLPEAGAEVPTRAAVESVAAPAPTQATILVVDDEVVVRSLVRAVLEEAGHTVVDAKDGADALRQVLPEPNRFDLVILDMTMPGMGGVECLGELRRVRSDLPVLMSSGYTEQDMVARLAGRGLSGFLQKPYTTAELRSAVDEALRAKAR